MPTIEDNDNEMVRRVDGKFRYPLWILMDDCKSICKHREVFTQWEIDFVKKIIKNSQRSLNIVYETIHEVNENGKTVERVLEFVLVTEKQLEKLEEIDEKLFMFMELRIRY